MSLPLENQNERKETKKSFWGLVQRAKKREIIIEIDNTI